MSRRFLKFGYMDRIGPQGEPIAMLNTRKRRTFIKEWRKHRGLTQEALAERVGMSPGNVSLIERGLQNYTQETLEAFGDALQCEPADLLMRNPLDSEGIWSVWDQAKPAQRAQIVEIAKTLLKTGT